MTSFPPFPAVDCECEFHLRVTRRDMQRGLGSNGKMRHRGRRLALLAAAIAVPAFASQPGWDTSAIPTTPVQTMPFEEPGHSFPGSAFYFLADTPETARNDQPITRWDDGAAASGMSQGARPFISHGSAADSARALECLAMAIYYEAASESDAGQRAVAQVVMNRVAHPAYPNTVCGVVFQGSARSTGCQFTFTCDGSLARRPEPTAWLRARSVARRALDGAVYAPIGLATHYHTIQVHPYWSDSLDRVGVIGTHIFYRWKGAAGLASAFHADYVGGEPSASALASERIRITDAADPVTLARAFELGLAKTTQHAAALPAPVYSAQVEARGGDRLYAAHDLPTTGSVRPEYAQSGQWLDQATH